MIGSDLLWDGCCRYDAIVCGIVFTNDSVRRSRRVVVHEQWVFHFHFSGLEKKNEKKTNAHVRVYYNVYTPGHRRPSWSSSQREFVPGGEEEANTIFSRKFPALNSPYLRIYRAQDVRISTGRQKDVCES